MRRLAKGHARVTLKRFFFLCFLQGRSLPFLLDCFAHVCANTDNQEFHNEPANQLYPIDRKFVLGRNRIQPNVIVCQKEKRPISCGFLCGRQNEEKAMTMARGLPYKKALSKPLTACKRGKAPEQMRRIGSTDWPDPSTAIKISFRSCRNWRLASYEPLSAFFTGCKGKEPK